MLGKTNLVEIVENVRREEPVLITPEVEEFLEVCSNIDYFRFVRFDRNTRAMERGDTSVEILEEIYARRLLAALYFKEQIENVNSADRDAIFAYDRAGSASNTLAVATNEHKFWFFRSALTRLSSAKISETRCFYQDAFYSYAFVADSTLSALELKKDLSVVPGFSYGRVLDIFINAVGKMGQFSPYCGRNSKILDIQGRVSRAYEDFVSSKRLLVHA